MPWQYIDPRSSSSVVSRARTVGHALAARRHYARRQGDAPCVAIDAWGRRMGMAQLRAGRYAEGLSNLLNPIVLPRYFEFDACLRHMPAGARKLLDVGSPRLVTLYLAATRPELEIIVVNPDPTDLQETQACAALMGIDNLRYCQTGIRELLAEEQVAADFIYSVSVLEHIAGAYDDTAVMPDLMAALAPDGVLSFTVPLSASKAHEDEYLPASAEPYPGTAPPQGPDGRYFFQRLYTEASIQERLVDTTGCDVTAEMTWWGEAERGAWSAYVQTGRYKRGGDCR
ncbi:MAG: class I SAM-dependent methyltransferase, partial [Myxococcota bacterium]|nr:class I SAM-dependent methyltransferase [Myxococcota bacterium]